MLIWWRYSDDTIDEVFDFLLHGDMLRRTTEDRGRVDDGTLIGL